MENKHNHKWHYCTHCQAPVVLCGHCGNNTCNGGSGCNLCYDAFEYAKSGTDCPQEFISRAETAHRIFNMSVDDVKNELRKPLTEIEVELLLEQYRHKTYE